MATVQSDLMIDLLKKIEKNTAKGAQSRSTNNQSSTLASAASALVSTADTDASTDALKNQTAAMEEHGEAVNMAAENVKEFLSYGEKLKNFAESGEKSFLGLNKKTLAYGKVLDDVFGGKLQKYGKKLFKFTGGIRKSFSAFKNSGKDLEALNKGLVGATSKFARFGAFAKFGATRLAAFLGPIGIAAVAIGGTMVKVFMQTMKVAAKLTKFFIALPLTMAASAAKIGNSIRRDIVETIGNAAQETKELFDMSDSLGGKIGQATKGLVQFAQSTTTLLKFKNVTNDFVKLFGDGAGGVTALIKEYTSVLTNAGVFADIFAENVAKISKEGTPDNLILLTKATRALGVSTQDFSYVALESAKNGESLFKTLDDIAGSTATVSKEFGLNVKLIRKNFFVLRNDIINFGHLTNEELSETVAKVTQMGVSVKEASSMFNKFGTFEDAANSAALLSQTFGMNVDALKLIRAEKPEEIIEMFSDAMFATGRSFDELNRHEKAVMAQHTGLSAEALKSVMNYKNMGMTYAEIQKKMAEDDPTVQQTKNIKSMTDSLKEMQKVITDTSFFESFKKGLTATITLGSGLDPIFKRISKRMQDFYISGLTLDKSTTKKISGIFSPITETFEKLVGKPGSKEGGIFNTKDLNKATNSFVDFFGDSLSDAFASSNTNKNLLTVQTKFTEKIMNLFEGKFDPSNSLAGKLMLVSGKLIGKFLKGFAALGPGLIKAVGKSFRGLVDWIQGYETEDNSLSERFKKFFNLKDKDIDAIRNTFYTLFDELKKSSGPFMSFFAWVQFKLLGLAAMFASELVKGLKDANPMSAGNRQYVRQRGDDVKKTFEDANITSMSMVDKKSLLEGSDIEQVKELGKLRAIAANLLKQEKKGKKDKNVLKILKAVSERLQRFQEDDVFAWESSGDLASLDAVMGLIDKENLANIRKPGTNKLFIENVLKNATTIGKSDDYVSDMLNGGKALLQGDLNGFSMQIFNPADQIMAGMSGGPIDAAIRYSGDMAAEVYSLIAGMISPAANGNNQSSNQPLAPIIIRNEMVVDGKTLATSAVKADIVGLMNNKNLGGSYSTLNDGTISNPSFGSTEGASY